jgi:hypothetical protein
MKNLFLFLILILLAIGCANNQPELNSFPIPMETTEVLSSPVEFSTDSCYCVINVDWINSNGVVKNHHFIEAFSTKIQALDYCEKKRDLIKQTGNEKYRLEPQIGFWDIYCPKENNDE